MSSIVDCPSCSRKLQVPADLSGELVRCPTCGQTFTATDDHASRPGSPLPQQVDLRSRLGSSRPVHPGETDYRDEPRHRDPDLFPHEERPWEENPPPGTADRPGKVQAIGIMTLIGGIIALLLSLGWTVSSMGVCCLWPGTYYSLILGILAIIKGSEVLGANAHRLPPPKTIAIMQIINIISGDLPNCVMGILTLVFLNDAEVRRYFRG